MFAGTGAEGNYLQMDSYWDTKIWTLNGQGDMYIKGKLLGVTNTRLSPSYPYQSVGASSTVEFFRYTLPSGKTLKIWAMAGYALVATGNVYLEVYNNTDGTTIKSYDIGGGGSWNTGTPITSVSYSEDKLISFRIRNSDSSAHDATGVISATVE